jgi:hypothetical protein
VLTEGHAGGKVQVCGLEGLDARAHHLIDTIPLVSLWLEVEMIRMRWLALALVCAATSTVSAQGTKQDSTKAKVKSATSKAATNTKKAVVTAAKDTKNATVTAAKNTGKAVGTAAKDTKNAVVTAAKNTGKAVGTAAKDTKNAVVKAAKDTKKAVTGKPKTDSTKKP